MASPEVLDFDQLLTPIPGENPAGRPLRADFSPTSLYQAIKGARSAARAGERNTAWSDEPDAQIAEHRANWKRLFELAPKAIAEESKDFEIAAWLSEALVREYGYAGLRDGFRLMRQLAETFWDNLYPLPDEEGLATRTAPLAGLNGEESDGVILAPIAGVPVTAAGSCRPLTLADHRRAVDLERLSDPDKRAQRIEQGAVTLQTFEKAVLETPPEFYRSLLEDLQACSLEFEKLCAVMEERCGKDEHGHSLAPPSSAIREALEASCSQVRGIARHVFPAEDGAALVAEEGGMTTVSPHGQSFGLASAVRTREDAFRALLQVADYFKRTEPHSPVAYSLEQAVRWGRMPLPELLTELIPEQGAREQIFKVVGIKPPEPPSS
jgi:type VI secretion system protein ImpA